MWIPGCGSGTENEVDIQLPVEGLLPVELETVDEKVQVLDEVRQVWKCLDVAVTKFSKVRILTLLLFT